MEWKNKCPIQRLESHILKEGLAGAEKIQSIHQDAEAEVAEAFEFAKASPFPGEDLAMAHIYAV